MAVTSRALRVGAAVAGVVALTGVAWWGLGAWVRAVAEEALARRVDGRVVVGAGSIRPTAITLSDVVIEAPGARAAAQRVVVSGSPFALAQGDLSAASLEVRGVDAEIDLASWHASRAEAKDAPANAQERDAGERARALGGEIALRDAELRVLDDHGELVRLQQASAVRSGSDWRFEARAVRVGDEDGERIAARDVSAELRRAPLAISRAEAAQVDVVVADGAQDPSARLRARVLAAMAPRAGREDPGGSSGDRVGGSGGRLPKGLAGWLQPGAALAIRRGSVTSLRGAREEALLQSFSARLARNTEGGLDTSGEGTTPRGGRLAWSFAMPSADAPPAGQLELEALPLALVAALLPDLPLADTDLARVDARLSLAPRAGGGPVDVSGRLALTDLALEAPTIAAEPIREVAFRLEGEGAFERDGWELSLRRAVLGLGEAEVRLSGRVALPDDDVVVELTAVLPPTDCNAAVHAIPRDVLGDYVGFSFDGQIAGRLAIVADTRDPDRTELEVDVADGCRFESVPAAADLRRFRGPFVHRVREPDGTWFEMTTGPGTGNWASIWRTSPYMIHALLGHEDGGFFRHDGFATWAIRGALERNLRAGKVVWGGSTITMQLAKNLFLARERTLARKVQEVLLTWWLESSLDKLELLELYFNVIEYGPGVYGLRNAAWHYFRRHPEELSPAEASYLACILPAPKRYQRSYTRGALTTPLRDRMERHLRHLHDRDRISAEALRYGLDELEGFTFADPEREAHAPPRLLPDGAAPIPGLGDVTPGGGRGGAWDGSPLDLDQPDDG